MTDGMLFRETMMDPLLSKYSVIMVCHLRRVLDEAHVASCRLMRRMKGEHIPTSY